MRGVHSDSGAGKQEVYMLSALMKDKSYRCYILHSLGCVVCATPTCYSGGSFHASRLHTVTLTLILHMG